MSLIDRDSLETQIRISKEQGYLTDDAKLIILDLYKNLLLHIGHKLRPNLINELYLEFIKKEYWKNHKGGSYSVLPYMATIIKHQIVISIRRQSKRQLNRKETILRIWV